jgi:hypothetical protein
MKIGIFGAGAIGGRLGAAPIEAGPIPDGAHSPLEPRGRSGICGFLCHPECGVAPLVCVRRLAT